MKEKTELTSSAAERVDAELASAVEAICNALEVLDGRRGTEGLVLKVEGAALHAQRAALAACQVYYACIEAERE